MTEIFIPHPERKRALFLVDIQKGFLKEHAGWIIPNIQKLIREGDYTLMIEAVFHADPGSLWDKQVKWTFPLQPTVPEIKELLDKETILVTKTTKSVFKGNVNVAEILKEKKIEEINIVGLDTNDCVFATAQESFDLGFFTYVIEECTDSSSTSRHKELRESALQILRHLRMTNHTTTIETKKII